MNPMTEIERQVIQHSWELKGLKEAGERRDANIIDIRKDVEKLEDKHNEMEKQFGKWVAAAEATERHAQKMANQAITARQFYVGVGLLLVAIIGLVLGIKA